MGLQYKYNPVTNNLDMIYVPDLTGYIPYTGGTSNVDLGTHNLTVDTNTFFVDSINDRIGIGTLTPSEKVTVNAGNIRIENGYTYKIGGTDILGKTNSNTLTTLWSSGGGFDFINNAGDTSLFKILNGGNVGIGVNSPGEKLEINGNLYLNTIDPIIYGYNRNTYIDMYNGSGGIDIKPLTTNTNVNILGNAVISGSLSFNGNLGLAAGTLITSSSNYIQVYNGSDASIIFKIAHPTVGHYKWMNKDDIQMMILTRTNNLGIGNITPTAKLDIDSDIIRLRQTKTPTSATDTGNAGDICIDNDYIYRCVATNTWKRVALMNW